MVNQPTEISSDAAVSRPGAGRGSSVSPEGGLKVLARWQPRGRSVRIVLLLVAIWIIGLADLKLTIIATELGNFAEGNPLAAALLSSPGHLAAFKLTLLTVATVIFLLLRKHLLAEIACWLMSILHVALAIIWRVYFGGTS